VFHPQTQEGLKQGKKEGPGALFGIVTAPIPCHKLSPTPVRKVPQKSSTTTPSHRAIWGEGPHRAGRTREKP